ncbi:hypothetical protein J4206_02905 [Candidatus Woesearchaeota archaeon]|nr:hypothetical protein [Candidatus Woesearchaeota archaeon]
MLTKRQCNSISLWQTGFGFSQEHFTWHPVEERILIKDEFYSNGSLKYSTYYFDDDYIVIQNSSGTYNITNIYQDGILVGYEDIDGRKRYVLPDHEGSVHIVLNESGDVIEENLFSPFAEPLHGVIENKFSYEAKEYDSLVQDYDFHARKYNPNLRIFMQPDTLIQNVYDPQSLNRYSFERNNPQKNTDPTGHVVWYIAIPLAIIITIILDYAYDKYYGDKNKNPNLAESGAAGGASEGIGQAAEKGLGKSAGKALPGVFDIIMEIPLTSSEDVCRTEAECVQKIEPKKEQTEEDLKCKIINCNYKYGVISDDNEDNRQSGSPSISNPSSQADSSKAISQTAQQNINQGGSGYVQGVGYVTSGGATYPTSNPYFVPGTGNSPWGGSYSNVVQDPSTGHWVIA